MIENFMDLKDSLFIVVSKIWLQSGLTKFLFVFPWIRNQTHKLPNNQKINKHRTVKIMNGIFNHFSIKYVPIRTVNYWYLKSKNITWATIAWSSQFFPIMSIAESTFSCFLRRRFVWIGFYWCNVLFNEVFCRIVAEIIDR
jgi:hypothetical protein